MEFTDGGDPPPRRIPSHAEMLAEFGQPVAVLTTSPPGTTLGISSEGVDDRIWCIDIDYGVNHQFTARVRTIRELTPPPVHPRGELLRSALIEFSANAELAAGATVADPDRPRSMQIMAQQEQRAALATPTDAQLTINGHTHPAVALHISGYRALLAKQGQTTVVYVGNDETPTPELRMTTTPERV